MKNCENIHFKFIGDEYLGYLVAIEGEKSIPFNIKRVYYTYGVPSDSKRGCHAHKELNQILICINGGLKVRCFDGDKECIYEMSNPNEGLFIGSMIWHEMFDYNENTVLVVLASDYYNESDYIRKYDEFLELCK